MVGLTSLCAQQAEPAAPQLPPARRLPERSAVGKASLQGTVRDEQDRAVPGVALTIRALSNGSSYEATTDAQGIFRLRDVPLDDMSFGPSEKATNRSH